MYRPIPVEEVIAAMPKKRQEAIAKRGAELVAKVERRMTLAALRKERKISQATVAEALGIGQMQISRLEKRKDPRLSTMARTVAAMGGHLTMIATFPDQEPVVLIPSQLAEDAREHDGWFRAKVQEALDNPRPGIPREQVEAHFAKRRVAALGKAKSVGR
ncbi:MAG: helix-turn-helix transcriptional regulator [Terracidiphilus sp.]